MMTMAAAAPDAATRTDLLDAARSAVQADLGKPAKFKVDRINVTGDHAFVLAHLENDAGGPLDYRGTRLAGAAAEGFVSHRFAALLLRRDERWSVVDHAIGPTDVAWGSWAAKHRVPEALFAQ